MAKASKNSTKTLSKNLFPVVGVGASAGGLDAFKKLIKAIPEKSGMAFIFVQHLHPDHSSALPEILQRETNIIVQEVSDNIEVKPNHIYIIPVNKVLVANDGVLHLSPRPKDRRNMPIDIFFESLAEVHQNHAIGIVLSGTGADGTAGLKKIKDHGGITFAQDMSSAAFDDMPENAIKNEVVDFVLAPEEMPQQLLKLEQTFNKFNNDSRGDAEHLGEEECFRQILALVRVRQGADFSYYKQSTIRRRILRRLAILKLEKITDYLDCLRDNKTEQDVLFQDLLIPVTAFFRDPKTFDNICKVILPELVKGKTNVNPLRMWIAGCSTGEEAYSLGMCLYEYLEDKAISIKIQIFATDLSEHSIAKARGGVYNKRQLEGVSNERLQQFFTKIDGHYQVKKTIRDLCVFATHNFLKDPPFARVDLISCRNVLIYMEPFLQKKAFNTFHYALNEKGYLLIGKSESTGSSSELFAQADKKDKLYIRKSVSGKYVNVTSESREEAMKDKDYGLRSSERRKDDYQKSADDILLAKYTPAGVIVNEQFDIVQFRGSTGAYLEPSPGKASLNVLKMAREGLSFELRNALHRVKAKQETFTKEGILADRGKKPVSIEVIPLMNTIEPHFLILFKDTVAAPPKERQQQKNKAQEQQNERIKILEKDLLQAREDMRSITEDQEAANEELQSANEELLSSSEELQSLNEELETSKEELQSTNEELITVNQELYDRNDQLNQARIFSEAVVTTIFEPLLVLTPDFRIKSANEAFYKTFSISEKEALGKVLFELQDNGWDIPGVRDKLVNLRKHKVAAAEWEVMWTFPVIGKRTICFNAKPIPEESGRELILLALDDITLRKQAEKIQNFANLKLILESIQQMTFSASPEGAFTYFNDYFLQYSGLSHAKVLEEGWLPVIHTAQLEATTKAWHNSIQTLEDFNMEFQLRRKSDGMYRWHICRASAIINDSGDVLAWVGAATDIDEQKNTEKAKDEFISIASHELKTPLTSAKAFVQLIEHNMQQRNDSDIIFARKAGASLNRLNALIMELLDVSKIQFGKLELNVSSFNFNAILTDAVEEVQLSTEKHKITLTGEVPDGLTGDKERLKQVMINLLTNAVKYSPDGDSIVVHTAIENNNISVSVRDEGIGINTKSLNKIFELYYREDGRDARFQGLGIGLAISRDIVRRHGGKIWAQSEPGKGSTFYFTLPVNGMQRFLKQ
jgi:two-component system CheB/CheR fusion protein